MRYFLLALSVFVMNASCGNQGKSVIVKEGNSAESTSTLAPTSFSVIANYGSRSPTQGPCISGNSMVYDGTSSLTFTHSCRDQNDKSVSPTVYILSIDSNPQKDLSDGLRSLNMDELKSRYVSSPSSSELDGPAYSFQFFNRDKTSSVAVYVDIQTDAILPDGLKVLYRAIQSEPVNTQLM